MRVNQKITVGSITINSVQNSSIVQIGSSGMIQSQSESLQSPPTANGNGGPANGTSPKGAAPAASPTQPNGLTPPGLPGNVPACPPAGTEVNGFTPKTYPFVNEAPMGPVGGIGITRDEQADQSDTPS
ncbi:spore germination protein GerPB [Fodinisporobacter ferrooxydans]|uniref:Spore germination protein GerPB n=1 Tax=Fodinisporobacter ferrooxydans TaxID=2901836 RepID=A0ABY4CJA8_9BACL|nr:spore germination protein GerPB [Alicyclobacillaceae bacterium MYW30-H2]